MISEANLNIVFDDNNVINLELSATQLKAICLVLGITDITPDHYDCLPDEGVVWIMKKLQKIEGLKNYE